MKIKMIIDDAQQKYAARIVSFDQKKLKKDKALYYRLYRHEFKSISVLFLKNGDEIAVDEGVFRGVRLYATAIILTSLQNHYDDEKIGFIVNYYGKNRCVFLSWEQIILVKR